MVVETRKDLGEYFYQTLLKKEELDEGEQAHQQTYRRCVEGLVSLLDF